MIDTNYYNDSNKLQSKLVKKTEKLLEEDKIICTHCNRSKTNGRPCLGICVADNNY